jgi:heme exporter protein C
MGLTYLGYLFLRALSTDPSRTGRVAAVVGIVGLINVPIVHFSVQWWRTLHPGPIIEAPGGPALPAAMLQAFMVTMVAVLFLAGTLVAARYRIEVLRERRDADRERNELQAAAQLPVGGAAG